MIRADFDYRDFVLRPLPGTFSVPTRYIPHMMVDADLATGDSGAIEDALEAAWHVRTLTIGSAIRAVEDESSSSAWPDRDALREKQVGPALGKGGCERGAIPLLTTRDCGPRIPAGRMETVRG